MKSGSARLGGKSMRFVLPVLGLLASVSFVGSPALAQNACADQAAKMQEALKTLIDTSTEKEKLAGQIAEGLSRCNAGTNNPWEGVDPRINKG